MTLLLECSRPWCWRPGYFRSRIMTRVWWGYVAIAWLHVSLEEYTTTAYEWQVPPAAG